MGTRIALKIVFALSFMVGVVIGALWVCAMGLLRSMFEYKLASALLRLEQYSVPLHGHHWVFREDSRRLYDFQARILIFWAWRGNGVVSLGHR